MTARRIPQSFIDDLITRANLLDVIGARVTLKKAGSNYKGLCPFHDEKTPSFSVKPDQGFYYCFGCGAHGTAISFLMDYENRSFPEAVRMLADMLGLEVPGEAAEQPDPRTERIYAALAAADRLYRRLLREHGEAVDYLKARGVDGATAARFGIGFAPDAWDTVLEGLGRHGFDAADLLAAGLVTENDKGRRYDRFRNRIMFPIRDPRGRVIGFGGRVLGDGEPKYLNSPETPPVFHKRESLYGLYEARQKPGRPERIVVVEGYLDVASLAQFGVEPAVATLGTATTAEHVRRLTRLADRVVFCFDGDRAGRAAAWRALNVALPFGGGSVEIRFLFLPEGTDPDSLVRDEGPDAFRARLDGAVTLSRFMIDELRRSSDFDADGLAKLVTDVRPLLADLPQGAYRELIIRELAGMTGDTPERFEQKIAEPARNRAAPQRAPKPPSAAGGRGPRIRYAIKLVMHYPAAAREVGPVEALGAVEQPGAALLKRLLETVRAEPKITTATLIERFRDDPEGRHLDRLAADELLDDEQAAVAVLRDSIHHIVAGEERRRAAEALKRRPGRGP